ncbi:hypothetical protein CLIB1423_03S02366 [[Candida] railenensis]|uniref:Uncharacterized protein n=1 Tax=[Candida] railenensis TaxID=45579 RepID=A0A9P0QL98_9ASCO|nr:hypothetical protein CLIB1423_03S02366 [[Candida] railenensis]
MSLKRKRLDEILSTSIEDIENMFSWKIGARKAECLIREPSTKTTKEREINNSETNKDSKKRKFSSSDANSCFSSQYSAPSTNSSHNVNTAVIAAQAQINSITTKEKQIAQPQTRVSRSQVPRMILKSSRCTKFPLSIDTEENYYDDITCVPSIDMIDTLIQRGSSLH